MSVAGRGSIHKLLKALLMWTEGFYVLNGTNENSNCETQDSDDIKGSV
jgi:hypothetical protein